MILAATPTRIIQNGVVVLGNEITRGNPDV
jgi:hypothetical protein